MEQIKEKYGPGLATAGRWAKVLTDEVVKVSPTSSTSSTSIGSASASTSTSTTTTASASASASTSPQAVNVSACVRTHVSKSARKSVTRAEAKRAGRARRTAVPTRAKRHEP